MPLLERDVELADLRACLRALADDGAGGVVLVEGPAGIGKSALIDAALGDARGVTVLRARGAELEGGLTFGTVRELFGVALMQIKKAEREALFDGPAALARPVLGFAAEGVPAGDPLYGLLWFAAGLAERTPLVIAIDDLHWIDEESGRFAAYLAERLEGLPILLLAGARPAEPGAEPGPAAALAQVGTVMRPQPLSENGIAQLVPGRPTAEVRRATGGNPLLILELSRGPVATDAGAGAVLDRVAAVSEDAVALARAVSLSAEPIRLGDAAALAALDEGAAVALADALIRAEVLASDEHGRLAFSHPLQRTEVYESLAPFERRLAHRHAARLLADRGADIEAIAAHLLAGEPAGDQESVRLLRSAADRSLARAAPRAAVRYLQRALDEPPPPGEARVGMRTELGRLQLALGRVQAITTLRSAYDESAVPERRVEIAITLAEGYVEAERLDEAMELLRRVQETLDLGPEDRLESDALLLIAAIDRGVEPELLAALAARIPTDLPGATPAERRALTVRAYVMLIEGHAAADIHAALARAANDEDVSDRPAVTTWYMRTLSVAGLAEEAEALARELLELARATGAESLFAGAQLQLAVSANQRGELRDCEAALRLGLAAPGCTPQYRVQLEDWLVTTLSMQGRFAEAEQLLSSMAGRDANLVTRLLDRRRVELALDRGDYAAALEPAERVYRLIDGRLQAASGIAADYALALAGVGRLDEAEALARRHLERAEHSGNPQTIGLAHHALGRALRGAEAIEHLRRAVAVLDATPFRWNRANAEVDLGGALRREGERVAAREPLRSALDYATRHGAAPIEQRAREELRLAGARPRKAVRTGVDALTPSEDRIARLAAEGMTNRAIAAHLFLTVRTVEMHLGSTYRKLDIKGRDGLARALGMWPVAEDGSSTVVFTDIERSSELVRQLGDDRWTALMAHHETQVRELARANRGVVIKGMGDGFMLGFPAPRDAATFAVGLQRALDDEGDIRVRIGLHSGHPQSAAGDLFGNDVNIASRVAANAAGAEILCSPTTVALLEGARFGEPHRTTLRGQDGEFELSPLVWRGPDNTQTALR